DTLDGKNPHFVSLDELHRHRTSDVFDVLFMSMVARRQPLMLTITTAGWDRNSVCWAQREYSLKILEGTLQNDDHFAYVAAIDENDDPFDENIWIKANPNLGV